MKKYFLLVIAIVLVTVMVSGCVTEQKRTISDVNTTMYNDEAVSFNYPSNWKKAESLDNDTIAAVAEPNKKDPNTGLSLVSVSIQNKKIADSFGGYYESNYNSLFKNRSYKLVEEGNLTLKNYEARTTVYEVDNGDSVRKYKAVWIYNKASVYVILCSAPSESFDSYEDKFEIIINSFNIK